MVKGSDKSNVVYLTQLADGRGGGMPYSVERLRREMEGCLVVVLRNAISRAQENFAQTCENSAEPLQVRQVYRDSELSFRLHRHDMEEVLRAGLDFRFRALVDLHQDQVPPMLPQVGPEQAFIGRVCAERLAHQADRCTRLLDRLIDQRAISAENSPLAPEHVADLFLRVGYMARIDPAHNRLALDILAEELEESLPRFYRTALAVLAGEQGPETAQAAAASDSGPGREGACAPGGAAAESVSGGDLVARARRSRQQVEQGRQRVARELERCLAGRAVPDLVRRLIQDEWARLLLIIYVGDGPEADVWVRNCAVMERLVWSFQPPTDELGRQRLVLEIPLLLHEVTDGLRQVLQHPFELTKLLRALEGEYLQCLIQDDPELKSLSANDEPVASALQADDFGALEKLPEGTWLEVKRSDGEPLRVRLAGTAADGAMVFTDRAGFKAIERTPYALAAAIARGEAKVLNDEELLNGGLARVMRRLTDRSLGHGD